MRQVHPRAARIGVVAALRLETGPLRPCSGLLVRVCGVAGPDIGEVIDELHERGVGLVVSWGTAGALSPRLRAGDLILPPRVVTRSGDAIATDRRRDDLRRAFDETRRVAACTLVESGCIVATPDDKRTLGRQRDAGAVDMESGRIGEACAAANLPFMVIRAVLDELDDRLPGRILQRTSGHGSLRLGALLVDVTRHPGDWGALARLARRYGRARAGLAAAARVLERFAHDGP